MTANKVRRRTLTGNFVTVEFRLASRPNRNPQLDRLCGTDRDAKCHPCCYFDITGDQARSGKRKKRTSVGRYCERWTRLSALAGRARSAVSRRHFDRGWRNESSGALQIFDARRFCALQLKRILCVEISGESSAPLNRFAPS